MAAESSVEGAHHTKRRWYQFNLRLLFGIVALCAVGLGLWRLRGWWYLRELRDSEEQVAAYTRLLEWSDLHVPKEIQADRIDVWPEHEAGLNPGWVWVRHTSELRCITPNGDVVETAIVVNGAKPRVVWNGTIRRRPTIAIYNAAPKEECYFMVLCLIRSEEKLTPLLQLMVELHDPNTFVDVLGGQVSPTFVLRSADQVHAERFSLEQTDSQQSDANPSGERPWKVTVRCSPSEFE